MTQGGKGWGKNQIITGLNRNNRWLRQLDTQFFTHLEESNELGFPTPLVNEICAESDQSVPTLKNRLVEQVYVRGTHKTVKIPNRSNAPIVDLVAHIISKYPTDVSLAIVDKSLARIDEVNKAASISSLIGVGRLSESEQAGEAQAIKALPMIARAYNDQFSLDDRSRALQRALLTPIFDTFSHPNFVIRAVHYLYYLVAAKQHNVLDHTTSLELGSLLLPGCDFETIVRSF